MSALEATFNRNGDWRSSPVLVANYNQEAARIAASVADPQLIQAVLLIFAKLLLTTGIALFISTLATSSIFTIVTTFMIYLIGHMEGAAREAWLARGGDASFAQSAIVGLISVAIPDMNSFTIVDEILAGNQVPWASTLSLLGYAMVYLFVVLSASVVVFEFREV
jgi:hypothetical protein